MLIQIHKYKSLEIKNSKMATGQLKIQMSQKSAEES